MATFIRGNDLMFNSMIYGAGNNSADMYLQGLRESFQSGVHHTVLPMVANLAGTVFQAMDMSKGMDYLRAIGERLGNVMSPYTIIELIAIAEMQQANMGMRRWIMSCPEIIAYHQQGLINGYDGQYTNHYPNDHGVNNYDYRCATNGMFMDRPNGEFAAMVFFDADTPEEDKLSFADRCDIQYTWDNVRAAILAGGGDPTSPSGDNLA